MVELGPKRQLPGAGCCTNILFQPAAAVQLSAAAQHSYGSNQLSRPQQLALWARETHVKRLGLVHIDLQPAAGIWEDSTSSWAVPQQQPKSLAKVFVSCGVNSQHMGYAVQLQHPHQGSTPTGGTAATAVAAGACRTQQQHSWRPCIVLAPHHAHRTVHQPAYPVSVLFLTLLRARLTTGPACA